MCSELLELPESLLQNMQITGTSLRRLVLCATRNMKTNDIIGVRLGRCRLGLTSWVVQGRRAKSATVGQIAAWWQLR